MTMMNQWPRVRSIAYRTDLMIAGFEGRVEDGGDCLIVRTPASPRFYYGNFLLFPRAPREGDLDRWTARFREAFAGDPAIRHVALCWDCPDGEAGVTRPFVDAGFVLNDTTVLTGRDLHPPPHPNEDVEIRRLSTDADWEAVTRLQIAVASERLGDAEAFQRDQMARYRRLVAAGRGVWLGAFDGGALVADLGVFVDRGLGRFQSVETAPSHRGRGICGALVCAAARVARAELGAERLVMVTDPEGGAARVYRSVGLVPTETLFAVWRRPV
ncbi:MAG: GNAT family N-acetyltransferase [Polyangiaceae bacterium]|nr:GNAT family N-acetyltransferase [Polyangiaceae bacterium]